MPHVTDCGRYLRLCEHLNSSSYSVDACYKRMHSTTKPVRVSIARLIHSLIDDGPPSVAVKDPFQIGTAPTDDSNANACTCSSINTFLERSYRAAKYSSCCEVSAMVILCRVLSGTDFKITRLNWRGLIFTAIMLSQKLNDDVPLPNDEFAKLWNILRADMKLRQTVHAITTKQLSAMEVELLKLVNWDVGVISETFWLAFTEVQDLESDDDSPMPQHEEQVSANTIEAASATSKKHSISNTAAPAREPAVTKQEASLVAQDIMECSNATSNVPAPRGRHLRRGASLPDFRHRLQNPRQVALSEHTYITKPLRPRSEPKYDIMQDLFLPLHVMQGSNVVALSA